MLSAFEHTSSDYNCSLDDDSMNLAEDSSDVSEQSLPTLNGHSKRKDENSESPDRIDQSLLAVSRISGPVISVVMHLELQNLTWFEISQASVGSVSDAKVQLQWSCKEPAEVGRPPTFELKVSTGWEGCYDLATGVLTAVTNEGDPLRYEIPGVSKAQTGVNIASSLSRRSSFRFTQQMFVPVLVRFCQCLALRTMQLRQIALRGEASKLPFVHYDTLPASLLASFRYRSSLFHQGARRGACLTQGDSYKTQRGVDLAGIGRGQIDASGDLSVVYLDGTQLTLAASGLQLRFRPSWAADSCSNDSATDDVFELLTSGTLSSFLPSAVKQKLASIPEFIRQLKAAR